MRVSAQHARSARTREATCIHKQGPKVQQKGDDDVQDTTRAFAGRMRPRRREVRPRVCSAAARMHRAELQQRRAARERVGRALGVCSVAFSLRTRRLAGLIFSPPGVSRGCHLALVSAVLPKIQLILW